MFRLRRSFESPFPVFLPVLGLLIGGCGSDSEIRTAYQDYRSALASGDIHAVVATLAHDQAASVDTENADQALALLNSLTPPSPTIESVETRGSRATIHLSATGEGSLMTGEVDLVKESGGWKLSREEWSITLTAFGGDWAGALRNGSASKPRPARHWQGHVGATTALAFAPDGTRLLTIGYDDYFIRVWDRSDGTLVDQLKLDARPCDLAMFPDGTRVAVVDARGKVTVWPFDYGGFGEPTRFRGDAGKSPRIAAGPDGDFLVTSGYQSPMYLWSVTDRCALDPLPLSDTMRGVAFSPRGSVIAAGSQGQEFNLWECDAAGKIGKHKQYQVPKVSPQSDVYSVAFSPDGKYLATGHMDASITVWNLEKKKQIHDFFVQDASARDVAFSPDGTLFATAQQNGRVYLWDAETGIELAILSDHKAAPVSVAFNPAEWEMLASGSEDGEIILWQ